jgi:hypothetical protein
MRMLALFAIVSLLHFVVSVVGIVVTLPAAFDTQAGFWAAPGKALLAWVSAVLLAPLAWVQPVLPEGTSSGYAEIAVVSILFGATAVGLALLWSTARAPKGGGDVAS